MSEIKLFSTTSTLVHEISGGSAEREKDIQNLFEKHLETLLGVRFISSEYRLPGGGGRIDTLGLDANNNPVIIEYKRNMTSHGNDQILFYSDWLMEHRDNFYVKVLKEIDQETAERITWDNLRLICVAADFGKYGIRAANQTNNKVELVQYKRYGNELLLLEFLNESPSGANNLKTKSKPPRHRGKRKNSSTKRDTVEQKRSTGKKKHAELLGEMKPQQAKNYRKLESFLKSLGKDVKQSPQRYYETFLRGKNNFASLELKNSQNKIYVWLHLDPKQDIDRLEEGFTQDKTDVGHLGSGDLQVSVSSDADIERAKPLIQKAYDRA